MDSVPVFPEFKPVERDDIRIIKPMLRVYQPDTSEWTFTNLYIMRRQYRFQWSLHRDWLMVIAVDADGVPFGLQPLGPPPRGEPARRLLNWLLTYHGAPAARIERADGRFVDEATADMVIEESRNQFDYLYRTADLITLQGRDYHGKRNLVRRFMSSNKYAYEPLNDLHARACLELTDEWCRTRGCDDDTNLIHEWESVCEALLHHEFLGLRGGVILVEGLVQAFTMGEMLNRNTAVVHIEKANADFVGLYQAINQQFCKHTWKGTMFVNREQDLGDPGMRRAKLSYRPHRLVEKYRIRLGSVAESD